MRQLNGRWRKAVFVGMGILVWFLAIAAAVPSATQAQQRQIPGSAQTDLQVVRIKAVTAKERAALSADGLDLLEMRDGDDLFALVTAKDIQRLKDAGYDVRIDADQTQMVQSKAGINTVQGGYRTVEEGQALLNTWQANYPNLAKTFTYGSSWDKLTAGGPAGYDLRGITLTNRLIPGPKPTFVLVSAIHAREMSTAELSLRFADYLLTRYNTDADVTWLLNEHQVVIIPFVNPDGRKDAEAGIYQRKNKDTVNAPCSSQNSSSQPGVDLNRNSHFYWGTVDTPSQSKCSQTYPGPSVASEPEVSSLENWLSKVFIDQRGPGDNDPAPTTARDLFLTLHSYSDLVLWPYGWTNAVAPNDADLAGLGRKFATYNGFTPQKSTELYPTSGTTDDWVYGVFGVASYTFEVGGSSGTCGGFFPAFTCLDSGTNGNFWGRNLPAFLYAAKVARTPYLLQRGPDALTPAVASVSGGYQVSATVNDTKNGNQTISAAEFYLDTPPWSGGAPIAMTASDGSFNSTSEAVRGTISSAAPGKHLVYVRGRDAGNNWGPVSAAWLDISGATPTPTAIPTTGPTATPTTIPTTGPTATPTNTPLPTATTPPGGDAIVNGGWETGTTPWVEASSGGYAIRSTSRPHAGSYGTYMGGYNSATESVYQTVTVPTNGSLKYWWYMTTQETGATAYDYLRVRIYNSSGTLLSTARTWSNASTKNAWSQDTVSLAAYAGQSVRVKFEVTTDSSLTTSFYVDDVSLTGTNIARTQAPEAAPATNGAALKTKDF